MEHEEILVEHEQFMSRHKQLLQEGERRREELEHALKHGGAQHALQSQEQSELIVQLRHETEEVTAAFKTQLHGLQEEHNKVWRVGCEGGGVSGEGGGVRMGVVRVEVVRGWCCEL